MNAPQPDLQEADQQKERAAPPPPDDGSIKASVARLIASGRELAEAEFAWAKIKAGVVANGLRRWFILISIALIFLSMGVIILIVSAIIALAPVMGLLLASLTVAGLSIALAIVFALMARSTFARMFSEEDS